MKLLPRTREEESITGGAREARGVPQTDWIIPGRRCIIHVTPRIGTCDSRYQTVRWDRAVVYPGANQL